MNINQPKPTLNQIDLNQLPVSGVEMGQLMQDLLAKDTPIRFKATGNSMKPFIVDGDLLTIAPKSQIKPTVGKVAAFINPGNRTLLVHRIIDRKSSSFLIKGDNSHQNMDGWVHISQVLGCVTGIVRDNRDIRFGLGMERFLLAFLSKHAMLTQITKVLQKISQMRPM